MKTLQCILLLLLTIAAIAQQPYYDDVNIQLTGQALYEELQTKLETYNIEYNYSDYRDGMPITDANPENNSEVLLVYGFNDGDSDCTTDRTRDNQEFGGDPCEYNREHTFARSLASPGMGSANSTTTGIAADPHNLRPSDVQRNGLRGSRKFAAGSGNSGILNSGNWYPGDEWRGDIARAMMYMYVRYDERCLPSLVGEGALEGDTQMLQLFLEWNVADPVSEFEIQRNEPLEEDYGSRNPFIDNPFLATRIWGGPPAENRWENLSVTNEVVSSIRVYPNPVSEILIISNVSSSNLINLFDLSGKRISEMTIERNGADLRIDLSRLSNGIYFLEGKNFMKQILKI